MKGFFKHIEINFENLFGPLSPKIKRKKSELFVQNFSINQSINQLINQSNFI